MKPLAEAGVVFYVLTNITSDTANTYFCPTL